MARVYSPLDEPKTKRKVVAMLAANGQPDAAVAKHFKTTGRAISEFRKRHADAIRMIEAQVREAAVSRVPPVPPEMQFNIIEKGERLRALQALFGMCWGRIEDVGLVKVTTRYSKAGDEFVEEAFDPSIVKEVRGVLSDVATELGELPDAPTRPSINILQLVNNPDLQRAVESGLAAYLHRGAVPVDVGDVREP